MKKSILLISTSHVNGDTYLQLYREPIKEMLKGIPLLLYIPYAVDRQDWDAVTQTARTFFNAFGVAVIGIHQLPDDRQHTELKAINAVFIEDGNVFRLQKQLQAESISPIIRSSVLSGDMIYIGCGAGAKITSKSVRTVDGMDVFYAGMELQGLDICPFQLELERNLGQENGEYSKKTLSERVADFHQINSDPVIAMKEGAYVTLETKEGQVHEISFGGKAGSKIFCKDKQVINVSNNSNFAFNDKILLR